MVDWYSLEMLYVGFFSSYCTKTWLSCEGSRSTLCLGTFCGEAGLKKAEPVPGFLRGCISLPGFSGGPEPSVCCMARNCFISEMSGLKLLTFLTLIF